MTKGRVALPFKFDAAEDGQQVPPLRYAPVGMTLLFGVDKRTSRISFSSASSGEKTFPREVRGTADPSAPPDFLSRVAASVNYMWFSLRRTT
jgi:hypothetical protein